MMLHRSSVAVLVLLTVLAAPVAAQEDEEGCKDHPMFSRMPNFYISGYEDQEFSAFEFELSDGYQKVKAFLVKKGGIAADRLTTAGLGDTQPVADNGTEEGRAQNRRVVLVRKS